MQSKVYRPQRDEVGEEMDDITQWEILLSVQVHPTYSEIQTQWTVVVNCVLLKNFKIFFYIFYSVFKNERPRIQRPGKKEI